MAYNNPSAHEKLIAENLEKIAKAVQAGFIEETGEPVDFTILCSSVSEEKKLRGTGQTPIGMYISTLPIEYLAVSMYEILFTWHTAGDIPAYPDLRDASGRSVEEVLKSVVDQSDKEGTPMSTIHATDDDPVH